MRAVGKRYRFPQLHDVLLFLQRIMLRLLELSNLAKILKGFRIHHPKRYHFGRGLV